MPNLPRPRAAWLLALLLALPLPASADPNAAARMMALMWETMLRFFSSAAGSGMGMPVGWNGWTQPGFDPISGFGGWTGSGMNPWNSFGEWGPQGRGGEHGQAGEGWSWGTPGSAPGAGGPGGFGGPWEDYSGPRGYTGATLDGAWLSASGEMLRIENGRFALGDQSGRMITGLLERRGDVVVAYAPQFGVSQQFRFLQSRDLLVFVDPTGSTIAFRRLSR